MNEHYYVLIHVCKGAIRIERASCNRWVPWRLKKPEILKKYTTNERLAIKVDRLAVSETAMPTNVADFSYTFSSPLHSIPLSSPPFVSFFVSPSLCPLLPFPLSPPLHERLISWMRLHNREFLLTRSKIGWKSWRRRRTPLNKYELCCVRVWWMYVYVSFVPKMHFLTC